MKRLALVFFFGLALAQPLRLEEALKLAPSLDPVQSALTEEEDKRRALEQTLLDPLRTDLSELQARQAYALAQAKRKRAQRQAEGSLAKAYLAVLEADLQEKLAQKALEIAQKAGKAAEIRLKGGGATALEVERARRDRLEAERNLRLAQVGLFSAQAQLESLTGRKEVAPLGEVPRPPESLEGLLEENPDLLALRQNLALLDFQLGLLDESFTPRRDMEALKAQRESLAKTLKDAERGLRLFFQSGLEQIKALYGAIGVAEAALGTAQAQLQADQKRFKAGLLSGIGLLQSELSLLQAELSLLQAKAAYLKAYYELLGR